jgi:hypothetical protein
VSRIYVHSKKYNRRNARLVKLLAAGLVLFLVFAGVKLYFQYNRVNQTDQSVVDNPKLVLTGYINPYFMFKDTGKWVQSKADSSANKVVYYLYKDGAVSKQLAVYINKSPITSEIAANHALPVKVVNGDSLAAGNLSKSCSSQLAANQRGVREVTINGTTIICDPNNDTYSVILAQTGGTYQIKLTKSKTSTNFIIVYQDFSGRPDPQTIINIANSFKAI